MDISLFLIIIITLLALISALLIFIIWLLRKYHKNAPDWSLVYPELTGLYEGGEGISFSRNQENLSENLDQMLMEDTPIPENDKNLHKFQNDLSSESQMGNNVLCTAYAPETVEKDEEFIVAAFASLPEQKEEVEQAAHLIDDEMVKRAEKFLNLKIKNGDKISFLLHIDHCEIDDPSQIIIWQGEITSAEFGVKVEAGFMGKKLLAKLQISVNGIPAGHIKFKIKIEAEAIHNTVEDAQVAASLYKNAFISYASPDRNEVLMRTQMLSATGMSFFQDIMKLKPGELWEKSLYKEIDHCDVFFLFWSSAAKKSKWVMEEYKYAQTLQSQGKSIEIIPIPIEGPPAPEPPEELSHLHFNDGFLYFMRN